jgi:hypothetical protein
LYPVGTAVDGGACTTAPDRAVMQGKIPDTPAEVAAPPKRPRQTLLTHSHALETGRRSFTRDYSLLPVAVLAQPIKG